MKNLILFLFICVNVVSFAQREPIEVRPPSNEIGPPPSPPSPPIPPDTNMVFTTVDEYAEFPGGRPALFKFLADNIKYPVTARESNAEGKCYLKFVVSKNGNISDVKVARKVPNCPECDDEAIRVVKLMPKWIPAKVNGKAVNSSFTLPIVFKLN